MHLPAILCIGCSISMAEVRQIALNDMLLLSPLLQALLATLLMWALTACGAATVFLTRRSSPPVLDGMLAFGAGVMLAASFWSLLDPALARASQLGQPPAWVAAGGFLTGSVLLLLADALMRRRLDLRAPGDARRRAILLVSSITLHNIPEGLAVGVAFGALTSLHTPAAAVGAWLLAIGVAVQNFPEGAAVSLPLRREGLSPARAFLVGQATALVEPLAGIAGALLATYVQGVLPFALSLAAGAMIMVVVAELIPESQHSRFAPLMTLATLLGFVLMMILDVSLG